jgi:hypothetical protein
MISGYFTYAVAGIVGFVIALCIGFFVRKCDDIIILVLSVRQRQTQNNPTACILSQ